MVLFMHELRQGRTALLVWTAVIAFLLSICIVIYPSMETQMNDISGMMANLGGFSEAFGMDKINFGEFKGFFSVECQNVLGLGGAFFASLLGISVIAKEEKEQTAEFLLTHPVSRNSIIFQKLCAMIVQIIILNAAVAVVLAVSVFLIGEHPGGEVALMFFACFLLQTELAVVCFGISAFISRGGFGIGLGTAAVLYFLNIIANLTENAEFLKYITPFGYAEGADIIVNGSINIKYLSAGLVFTAAGAAAAFYRCRKKDIC